MIDVIKQTPPEYSKQSRDYQILARLFTALYNFNKAHIDNMNVWNPNIDNRLAILRAKTLNFVPKHLWDLNNLEGAVSCFKSIMFLKGTKTAIEFCVSILMRINNLTGYTAVEVDSNKVIIKIPTSLASLGVVDDLMSYILPVGMTYRIIVYKLSRIHPSEKFNLSAEVKADDIKSISGNELGIAIDTNSDNYRNAEENKGYTIYHNNVVIDSSVGE